MPPNGFTAFQSVLCKLSSGLLCLGTRGWLLGKKKPKHLKTLRKLSPFSTFPSPRSYHKMQGGQFVSLELKGKVSLRENAECPAPWLLSCTPRLRDEVWGLGALLLPCPKGQILVTAHRLSWPCRHNENCCYISYICWQTGRMVWVP